MLKDEIEVGQVMSTVGGWEAVVVWLCQRAREWPSIEQGFYAVHKPRTEDETYPIWHDGDGKANAVFTVYERPCFGRHPADIIMPPKKE